MDDAGFNDYRSYVFDRAGAIVEEPQLEQLLDEMVGQAGDDLATNFGPPEEVEGERAEELLAHLEAWAAVASHATLEVYAGPLREVGALRRRLAGWARGVGARLTRMANLLSSYARAAMQALSAIEFSVGVSFPGGVSVSLTWS